MNHGETLLERDRMTTSRSESHGSGHSFVSSQSLFSTFRFGGGLVLPPFSYCMPSCKLSKANASRDRSIVGNAAAHLGLDSDTGDQLAFGPLAKGNLLY